MRKFLGKLDNFEDKVERNFQKKALKAYLRGWTHFTFGRDSETNRPITYLTPASDNPFLGKNLGGAGK